MKYGKIRALTFNDVGNKLNITENAPLKYTFRTVFATSCRIAVAMFLMKDQPSQCWWFKSIQRAAIPEHTEH